MQFKDFLCFQCLIKLIHSYQICISLGDIIIDDLRGAAGFLNEAGIHTADNAVPIISDKGKGVIDIVRIKVFKDGVIVVIILPCGSSLGGGMKQTSENQEFKKAVDIVLKLSKALIGSKKTHKAEFFEDPFQEEMGKEFGMAEAVGAALADREAESFNRLLLKARVFLAKHRIFLIFYALNEMIKWLTREERTRIAEIHSFYVLFQHNVPMLRHETHADLLRPVRPDTAKEEGECRNRLSAKHV